MTNFSAITASALSSPKGLLGGSPVELQTMLNSAPSSARSRVGDRAEKSGVSAGGLVSDIGKVPRTRHSAEQVKSYAEAYVQKCWTNYVKKFPESFSVRFGPTTRTPTLVFLRTQAEVDALLVGKNDNSSVDAFVQTDDPTRIYLNLKNFVDRANTLGPDYVQSVLAHELIHSLTNPVILRMIDDSVGNSTSYRGVARDLESNFVVDEAKYPGGLRQFSVSQLLAEFTADHFANKAEKLAVLSPAYAPLRAMGEKLLQLVGAKVFAKAMLENDLPSYRQVVVAAKYLQTQNAQNQSRPEKTKAGSDLRNSQTAAPFGMALAAATFGKNVARPVQAPSQCVLTAKLSWSA